MAAQPSNWNMGDHARILKTFSYLYQVGFVTLLRLLLSVEQIGSLQPERERIENNTFKRRHKTEQFNPIVIEYLILGLYFSGLKRKMTDSSKIQTNFLRAM